MLFVLVSLFVFLIYIYLSLPHILLIYFTFSPFLISDCATPTPYSILSIFQLCYSVIYIYTPWVSFFVLPVLTSFSISSFSLSVFTSHCSFISSWCIYLLHVPFSLSSNLSPSHLVFPLPSSSSWPFFIHLCRIPSRSIFPSLRFRSLTDSQSRFLTLEGESDEASGQLPDFFAKISEENGRGAAEGGGWSAENDEFANFEGGDE